MPFLPQIVSTHLKASYWTLQQQAKQSFYCSLKCQNQTSSSAITWPQWQKNLPLCSHFLSHKHLLLVIRILRLLQPNYICELSTLHDRKAGMHHAGARRCRKEGSNISLSSTVILETSVSRIVQAHTAYEQLKDKSLHYAADILQWKTDCPVASRTAEIS